jgi:hypothetical protein
VRLNATKYAESLNRCNAFSGSSIVEKIATEPTLRERNGRGTAREVAEITQSRRARSHSFLI